MGRYRLAGPGLRGGGKAREAKRGVILSVKLVSWEVESRRLVSGARVVEEVDKRWLSKGDGRDKTGRTCQFNNGPDETLPHFI
jgi:hypothetical protein